MSTAPNLRARRTDSSSGARRASAGSVFADGRPLWHFAVDSGALVVLLFLGVLGFSLSFGGDPRYIIAGLGGIFLGLGIAILNAHLRLGLLITSALGFGAYMLFGS